MGLGAALNRVVREGLSSELMLMLRLIMWKSGGKAFQAEGTAGAKTLRRQQARAV